jgi:hypothetical protein
MQFPVDEKIADLDRRARGIGRRCRARIAILDRLPFAENTAIAVELLRETTPQRRNRSTTSAA